MQPAKNQQRRWSVDERGHACGVFAAEYGPHRPDRGVSENDPGCRGRDPVEPVTAQCPLACGMVSRQERKAPVQARISTITGLGVYQTSWVSDQNLAWHLDFALRQQQQAQHDRLAGVDSFQHPDALTIRPRWAGEPFDLHACVQALFSINFPSRRRSILINKPHSEDAVHLGEH